MNKKLLKIFIYLFLLSSIGYINVYAIDEIDNTEVIESIDKEETTEEDKSIEENENKEELKEENKEKNIEEPKENTEVKNDIVEEKTSADIPDNLSLDSSDTDEYNLFVEKINNIKANIINSGVSMYYYQYHRSEYYEMIYQIYDAFREYDIDVSSDISNITVSNYKLNIPISYYYNDQLINDVIENVPVILNGSGLYVDNYLIDNLQPNNTYNIPFYLYDNGNLITNYEIKSSNPSVATINSDGVITTYSPGVTYISVEEYGYYDFLTIIVGSIDDTLNEYKNIIETTELDVDYSYKSYSNDKISAVNLELSSYLQNMDIKNIYTEVLSEEDNDTFIVKIGFWVVENSINALLKVNFVGIDLESNIIELSSNETKQINVLNYENKDLEFFNGENYIITEDGKITGLYSGISTASISTKNGKYNSNIFIFVDLDDYINSRFDYIKIMDFDLYTTEELLQTYTIENIISNRLFEYGLYNNYSIQNISIDDYSYSNDKLFSVLTSFDLIIYGEVEHSYHFDNVPIYAGLQAKDPIIEIQKNGGKFISILNGVFDNYKLSSSNTKVKIYSSQYIQGVDTGIAFVDILVDDYYEDQVIVYVNIDEYVNDLMKNIKFIDDYNDISSIEELIKSYLQTNLYLYEYENIRVSNLVKNNNKYSFDLFLKLQREHNYHFDNVEIEDLSYLFDIRYIDSLYVGDLAVLNIIKGDTSKILRYYTSDKNIVTISDSGIMTMINPGYADVGILDDNYILHTISIEVKEKEEIVKNQMDEIISSIPDELNIKYDVSLKYDCDVNERGLENALFDAELVKRGVNLFDTNYFYYSKCENNICKFVIENDNIDYRLEKYVTLNLIDVTDVDFSSYIDIINQAKNVKIKWNEIIINGYNRYKNNTNVNYFISTIERNGINVYNTSNVGGFIQYFYDLYYGYYMFEKDDVYFYSNYVEYKLKNDIFIDYDGNDENIRIDKAKDVVSKLLNTSKDKIQIVESPYYTKIGTENVYTIVYDDYIWYSSITESLENIDYNLNYTTTINDEQVGVWLQWIDNKHINKYEIYISNNNIDWEKIDETDYSNYDYYTDSFDTFYFKIRGYNNDIICNFSNVIATKPIKLDLESLLLELDLNETKKINILNYDINDISISGDYGLLSSIVEIKDNLIKGIKPGITYIYFATKDKKENIGLKVYVDIEEYLNTLFNNMYQSDEYTDIEKIYSCISTISNNYNLYNLVENDGKYSFDLELMLENMHNLHFDNITLKSHKYHINYNYDDQIYVGDQVQLVLDRGNINDIIKWYTSDRTVATISDTGLLTALKDGMINVYVVDETGNYFISEFWINGPIEQKNINEVIPFDELVIYYDKELLEQEKSTYIINNCFNKSLKEMLIYSEITRIINDYIYNYEFDLYEDKCKITVDGQDKIINVYFIEKENENIDNLREYFNDKNYVVESWENTLKNNYQNSYYLNSHYIDDCDTTLINVGMRGGFGDDFFSLEESDFIMYNNGIYSLICELGIYNYNKIVVDYSNSDIDLMLEKAKEKISNILNINKNDIIVTKPAEEYIDNNNVYTFIYNDYAYTTMLVEEPEKQIVKEQISKPQIVSKDYIYNGSEQTIEFTNFDSNKMNIVNNKRTNVGTQQVTISLKDGYIWEDGTSNDLIFTFTINKANISYTSSSNNKTYNGQKYGIVLNVNTSGVIVKYADQDNNYILDEMPMYSEIGEYTIKYKLYLDENYNEVLGEQKIIIAKDYSVIKTLAPSVSITTKNNTITITWKEIENAEGYNIYRSTDNKKWSKLTTTTNLSYTNTGLTYGTTYYYKVQGYNSKYTSKYSNVVNKRTSPARPTMKIASYGYANIKTSWDKNTTVTGYELYRSTDNKKWSKISTITKNSTTSYNNTKLTLGKTYYYKLRSYKTVGKKKIYSGYSSVVKEKVRPSKVSFNLNKNTNTSLKLTWSKVSGATYYEIDNCSSGTCKKLTTSKGTSYTISKLTLGKEYKYNIKACRTVKKKTTCGSLNTTKSQIVSPGVPSVSYSTTNESIKLSWKAVAGADKYIYTMGGNGIGIEATETTGTTLTFDELELGKTYNVAVKSYSTATNTESVVWSKNIKVVPATPTLKSSLAEYNAIQLDWNEIAGAVKYEVYRSTDNKKWSKIATPTTNTYKNTGLKYNTKYYYKVRAIGNNGSDVAGNYSAVINRKTYLATPKITVSTNSYNSIKTKITGVSYTSGYEIYRATSKKGKYSKVRTSSSLEWTNGSLTFNKTYYYKVRAYRTVGKTKYYSAYSSIVSAKAFLTKATLKAEVVDTNNIKISFNAISGRTKYEIYRSTDNKNWSKITTTTSTSYNDKKVSAGKTYYYKVRSYRTVSKKNYYSSYSSVVTIKSQTTEEYNSNKALNELNNLIEYNYSKSYIIYDLKTYYTDIEIQYALDNCSVDWNEQAVKKINDMTTTYAYSKSELSNILKINMFTDEEIEYAFAKTNISWKEQALKRAADYVGKNSSIYYSYEKLKYNLMQYDSFTEEEAIYAVNNCGANWNNNAIEQAKVYLKNDNYSYERLKNNLITYDKFTEEEAIYAIENCNINWKEQALSYANKIIVNNIYSKQYLIIELQESYDYTEEEATYAAENCNINWKDQAVKNAKYEIKYNNYSYEYLKFYLEMYEYFTAEEAQYAVDNCGANWKDQALKDAKERLLNYPYSYEDLKYTLEMYDKFTIEEAQYAVDNCGANWKDQALKSARYQLQSTSYSYEGLFDQLKTYNKFTEEEAKYAVDNCGADWKEQALKTAKQYTRYSTYTRNDLINRLIYDKYTQEQAEYVVDSLEIYE